MTKPNRYLGVRGGVASNLQKIASRRRGEEHHMTQLTDHEVELIRQLHEEEGWGSRRLAKTFECGRSTIRHIVAYRYRAG
jgi:ribosome-binding protein aMBF1 (putative translation factor)